MCRLERQHYCGRVSDRFNEENPMLPVKRVDDRCNIFFPKERTIVILRYVVLLYLQAAPD